MSTLVIAVQNLAEEVEECKKRENVANLKSLETDSKIDKLITVLTPITSAHDSRIQAVVTANHQNTLQWALANPGKAIVLAGVSIPAIVTVIKTAIYVIQAMASYGK